MKFFRPALLTGDLRLLNQWKGSELNVFPYFPLGVYKDITETEDKKMNKEILLAGFGGQGILFAGKVLAYCGLMDKKELSWSPSYGPEMRGGTANCSVCISDEPIASPLVTEPDLMMAMNQPSFEKFINKVKSRR